MGVMVRLTFFILLFLASSLAAAPVTLGVDRLFQEGLDEKLFAGKRIGLITNHTAINSQHMRTMDLFKKPMQPKSYRLTALFAPEHGLFGDHLASETIPDSDLDGIPVFSLHGKNRRPSPEMLKRVDLLIFDIQDIGSRSYTYISTLFYALEEAGKSKIPFIVLDRPNPLGGNLVDGLLVEEKWRSFVGCASIPYCHGMTVGELARFFNEEYRLGAALTVVTMRGWKREMTFKETGLAWVPTSPQIPDMETPFFYPLTGLLAEVAPVSIGVGYTLPFKVVGAPWISAELLAKKLSEQGLAGVTFQPFRFRPFFDKFKNKPCSGVLIAITDPKRYLPVTTQVTLLGVIKALYPAKFQEGLDRLLASKSKLEMYNKLNGSERALKAICSEKYFIWKLREELQKDRELFLASRKKYLLSDYK